MNARRSIAIVVLAALAAAWVAHFADPSGNGSGLVLLAAALVMGELLVLRLDDRSGVPLSYSVLIVLAASFHAPEYAAAVCGAEAITLVMRISEGSALVRVRTLAERIAVAGATIGVYAAVRALTHHAETVAAVLGALAAAAIAQVGVDLVARRALRFSPAFSPRARLAWLAIASSGMLMAIGYRGVGGHGQVGIWGPLLFSTPLLAAWYAFERLDAATRAYRQTIEALAMAPEFGGIVPPGHSQRVAALALAMASDLNVPASDMADLEMAALLHHLGQVTLDEPDDAAHPILPAEVAAVTSTMLREIKPLAGAGDIVAGDASDPRRRVAVQVLRVASDYDDLTARDLNRSDVAIEMLRSAPGYVYEERVLSSLERVLGAGLVAAAR